MLVSESLAYRRDLHRGDSVTLRTDRGPQALRIAGVLDGAEGRPFGYQLTFFRIAQSPKPVSPDSPWRANTLYMAHFSVSDMAERAFHDHEPEPGGHGACGCRSRHPASVAR